MRLGCDGITGSVDCWPCISVIYIQPHPQGKGKRPFGAVEMQIPYRSLYHFIIRAWPFFLRRFQFRVLATCNSVKLYSVELLTHWTCGFQCCCREKKNSKPDIHSFSHIERETDRGKKKESITSADLILNLTMK